MPTPELIHLSDEQMTAIWAAARPLPPDARGAFLEDVAREISRHHILGNGLLHRVIMVVQRRHFDPPDFAVDNGSGKWSGRSLRRTRAAR
jgi:hypothetical protein